MFIFYFSRFIIFRNEFIFYADRLARLLIEYAMNYMPFEDVEITTVDNKM